MKGSTLHMGVYVKSLSMSQLEQIQNYAEAILDMVASMKAGRKIVQGFLLKIDSDGEVKIVGKKEIEIPAEVSEDV